jgi:hypothetical protein
MGEVTLKGFQRPVSAFNVVAVRAISLVDKCLRGQNSVDINI